MAATHVMTSPSHAVAHHTPVSSPALSATPAASSSSKKQEHLIAGRRRLEEFKQKKRGEKSKVAPLNKQNVKQATEQVLSGSRADGLPSGGETVGDSLSIVERANGGNLEDFVKHDSSYAGKTFLDNKVATTSPLLPSEKLHMHLQGGSFSQISGETKTSTDAFPNGDFQLSRKLTNEDRPSSWSSKEPATFPQSHTKQDDLSFRNISHPVSDEASIVVSKDSLLVATANSGSMPLYLNPIKKDQSSSDSSASPSTSVTDLRSKYGISSNSSVTSLILNEGSAAEHNGSTGFDNLLAKVTASESSSLLAASRHEKWRDDGKNSWAEGNTSSHEKRSGRQDPHIGTVSQTENAQITSTSEFLFPKILHKNSEVVKSRQGVPLSQFTSDLFSNHSGPFQYANFHSSLKAPSSWSPSLSEAAPNEVLHTDLSSKLEPSRNSQDSNAIVSPPAFQMPFQVSTVTASHMPFSSGTDSLFSQQRLKITDTPPHMVKTENKVDRGMDNSSRFNLVDIANHSYVDLKFPTSGNFEKLRPSLDRLDEFASLEQHIEDLTQEKFSLQRGLDAARTLAESLAQENSALTEDFNQQGASINELKAEMERQQSEIHAQALIVNNLRMEREKAQQESNLAVERSQALAAEVVNLEERVLKVRSQELKLEKEVKMLMSENESQRSQISSMEKDRTNLRSLIEALQEEKKVLQARLRKAASTVVEDVRKSSKEISDASSQARNRVDVSTSTDDLGMQEPFTTQEEPAIPDSASSSTFMPAPQALVGSTSHTLNNLLVPNPWASIPSEQSRKIENIDVLITELAEEKAALVKTLKAESVAAVELRSLNAELSRKLETQTQQLELAVAQRMAHEGNSMSRNIYEASVAEPEFVDEGDEVVERVLGWIMKLFPGGSSRRGGSKQL